MVTEKDVLKIAKLSKLEFQTGALEKFTGQMNNILNFIAQLNTLDTTSVDPTSHAVAMNNAFREDATLINSDREKVLEQAPEQEAHFFRVPKVIA